METNIKDNHLEKENQVMNDKQTQSKVEQVDYKKMFEEARDALNHIKEMTKNNPTYLKYLEHSKDEGEVENEINRLDKIINNDRDPSANNK